ncbi:hypothetical protein I4U23_010919 [Adineta vaga]|nr:hypothetical protein I4U23_010919 [Adineta vaga]
MTERLFQKLRQLQGALEKYQGLTKITAEETNTTVSTNTHREIALCTNPQLSSREILDETQIFIRQTILRKCVVRSAQLSEFTVENRYVEDSNFRTSANKIMKVTGMAADLALFVTIPLIAKAGSLLFNIFVFSYVTKQLSTKNISTEYKIRDNLNKMMSSAIQHYNNEEYDKFIEFLCKPYYEERRLMDKRLGSETISIEIRVEQIIEPLLDHGFRADKIAYLLILIGEVLLRGVDFNDSQRKNPEHTALLEQSKILFQGTYDNPRLFEAAEKLDKQIESYHHQKIGRFVSKIVNTISEKDIVDARETPFTNRLRGYYRLARLNYAIACLLAGGKDNYERCKQSLKNLKMSENEMYDRFFYIPDERIQALEDLLSAFGMDNDSPNFTNPTNIHAIDHNKSFDIDNIEYLKTDLGYNACQKIIKTNDEDDQLAMLAQLIPNKHCLTHEQLIAHMLNKYTSDNELILAILRQEHVSNRSELANQFDSTKNIFKHQAYLPILSSFVNLKIHPCNIIPDTKYGMVFTTSHAVIDYTCGETEVYDLYVVVLPGHDRISHIFTIVPIEINHLHWQMEDTPKNHPLRAEVLLRIAKYYENEARQDDKRNHLAGLANWQKAQNHFSEILSMENVISKEQHDLAELGFCRCLLKQHRFSRINERLGERQHLSSAELWLIYAQAQRNMGDYNNARFGIQRALNLDRNNIDIQREEKAIKMKDDRSQIYDPIDLNSCSSNLRNEHSFYNILSIDGGGIRGIIPAIWLMSLERKIRQPISSIFHVIAGTSTGAIIGAGLTTPSLTDSSKARYQAADIVEIYRKKANQVFSINANFISQIRTYLLKESKYLDTGRHMLFSDYFGRSRLSDTVAELIIPAVKSDGNVTEIFTRQASLKDRTKNHLLTEVLMCTTAAPTYFPAYKLRNVLYVDGGVQANNPAMFAYDQAISVHRKCDKNRIRLLSLGTGDYVSDPLNPNESRNLLFWARNHQSVLKVLMDGPQNNIDLHLNNVLNENYHRWQIWLENPIDLDDIQPESIDKLIDLAYGHLEEMEAYDNRHRLGLLVEKLQSSFE